MGWSGVNLNVIFDNALRSRYGPRVGARNIGIYYNTIWANDGVPVETDLKSTPRNPNIMLYGWKHVSSCDIRANSITFVRVQISKHLTNELRKRLKLLFAHRPSVFEVIILLVISHSGDGVLQFIYKFYGLNILLIYKHASWGWKWRRGCGVVYQLHSTHNMGKACMWLHIIK